MSEEYLTLDFINKELTKINRAFRVYSVEDPLPIREIFNLSEAIILAGESQRKDLESMSPTILEEKSSQDGQSSGQWKLFRFKVIYVEAENYFDIVFSAPRMEKK